MRNVIYIPILLVVYSSCLNNDQEPYNNVFGPSFDIAQNNANIICSYYDQPDKSSIYQIDLKSNEKVKVSPNSEHSLIRPKYSPNNEHIVCLGDYQQNKNKLFIFEVNSDKLIELTTHSYLILECVFSPDGKYLYFTSAGTFENYSPIAKKAPHDVDIYKIEINTKEIKKITKFSAYAIYGLSTTIDGDSLLFDLTSKKKSGLFLMNIMNGGLSEITSANDLRAEKKLSPYEYSRPKLSWDDTQIAFTEPYELYIMDRYTTVSKRIFRMEPNIVMVADFNFFHSSNYLMISLPKGTKRENSSGVNYSFFTLNPENNELKIIDI